MAFLLRPDPGGPLVAITARDDGAANVTAAPGTARLTPAGTIIIVVDAAHLRELGRACLDVADEIDPQPTLEVALGNGG